MQKQAAGKKNNEGTQFFEPDLSAVSTYILHAKSSNSISNWGKGTEKWILRLLVTTVGHTKLIRLIWYANKQILPKCLMSFLFSRNDKKV